MQTNFDHDKQHGFIRPVENVCTNIILTTDVGKLYLIVGARSCTYLVLWDVDTSCVSPALLPTKGVWAKCSGQLVLWKGLLEMEVRVINRTSWDNWNLPVFLFGDGSLGLMYMASLMVLTMLCTSQTTKEKLSTPVMMTCGVGMVIDRRRGPEKFLEPFPKGPCGFL